MKLFVGLDIDPVAHEIAKARIEDVRRASYDSTPDLQVYTFVKNYKNVNSVLSDIEGKVLGPGINGILMDLGMSSMQVGIPHIVEKVIRKKWVFSSGYFLIMNIETWFSLSSCCLLGLSLVYYPLSQVFVLNTIWEMHTD